MHRVNYFLFLDGHTIRHYATDALIRSYARLAGEGKGLWTSADRGVKRGSTVEKRVRGENVSIIPILILRLRVYCLPVGMTREYLRHS